MSTYHLFLGCLSDPSVLLGCGKTSLIRAIVQCCEDIVHVDPTSQSDAFAQTLASTRPYPSWRSEIEGSGVLSQRRRSGSLNQPVLDRNITFLDLPSSVDPEEADSFPRQLERILRKSLDLGAMADTELVDLLSGNGSSHVDVVLYFLPSRSIYAYSIECSKLTTM